MPLLPTLCVCEKVDCMQAMKHPRVVDPLWFCKLGQTTPENMVPVAPQNLNKNIAHCGKLRKRNPCSEDLLEL